MNKKLEKYNPEWKNIYNAEETKIKEIMNENIETIMHIGSTSIEGLIARPIIDIMVTVDQLNAIPKDKLTNIYKVVTDQRGELVLTNETENILIYIIAENSFRKDDFTLFRDHLLLHPKRLREYNNFKEEFMITENYKKYEYMKKTFIKDTINLHKEIYMI